MPTRSSSSQACRNDLAVRPEVTPQKNRPQKGPQVPHAHGATTKILHVRANKRNILAEGELRFVFCLSNFLVDMHAELSGAESTDCIVHSMDSIPPQLIPISTVAASVGDGVTYASTGAAVIVQGWLNRPRVTHPLLRCSSGTDRVTQHGYTL